VRAYFDALLRYFEFSGRSSRAEYWLFQLAASVLLVAAIYADYRTLGRLPDRQHPGLFSTFVLIFHAVPQITLAVRRLHDIGKAGGWFFLTLVPFGTLWLLVWACRGGDPGQNLYGEQPGQDVRSVEATPVAHRGVRTGNAPPRPAARSGVTTASQRFI
jgi:uncharacterized membrane protein YhaH (DUF805 family)